MHIREFLDLIKRADKDAWVVIVRRDPCVYCGRRAEDIPGGDGKKYRHGDATKMTVEHVTPRCVHPSARPPGWQNLVGACWNCNHDRGSTSLLHYYMARQAQLQVALPRHRGARPPFQRNARVRLPPLRVPLGEQGTALWWARLKVLGA